MSKNILYKIRRCYGSPFLNIKAGNYTELIRTTLDKTNSYYTVNMEKYYTYNYLNSIKIRSIDDGENLFLSYANNMIIDKSFYNRYGYNFCIFDVFNKVANSIAVSSRRGKGNIILMHPEMYYELLRHKSYPDDLNSFIGYDNNFTYPYMGRWKYEGSFVYTNTKIYTSQHLNVDTVIITYKGNLVEPDIVGSILYDNDSLFAIISNYTDNDNNLKPDAGKYIYKLKIESVL